MKNANRVVVEATVRECVTQGKNPSRPFVVMLDGNRVGDFDEEKEANEVCRDVIQSLQVGLSFTGLADRFEAIGVLFAKLSAEYTAVAKECENALGTEDAPATPRSIGTPDTGTSA